MQLKMAKEGQPLFEVWMKQESDTIQALARAHGERVEGQSQHVAQRLGVMRQQLV